MSFLESVLEKHCKDIKGVLHIGAHYGEEEPIFSALGIGNQAFFEPVLAAFVVMRLTTGGGHPYFNVALGNINGSVPMFVDTANGQSSSILKPKMHLIHYPDVHFDKTVTAQVRRLDDMIFEGLLDPNLYDFMLIDVQGYELEVLRGAEEFINYNAKYIFCEVNRSQLYENGCLIEEIDAFLSQFDRVETTPWNEYDWGDALYIRR